MKRLPINFTDRQFELLRQEAHQEDKSMSEIIRKAYEEHSVRRKSEREQRGIVDELDNEL